MTPHHAPQVWRTTALARAGAAALAAVFEISFLLLILAADPGASAATRYVTPAVLMVLAPVGAWAFAFRPRVILDHDAVRVVNPLRSMSIPLTQITAVTAGYAGVRIRRRNGRPVSLWAVQKANIYKWMGRERRADRVAQAISAACDGE